MLREMKFMIFKPQVMVFWVVMLHTDVVGY